MASVARFHLPLRAPLVSNFSKSCLCARSSSRYPRSKARPAILPLSRWSTKSFTNSAILREKRFTKDHEWIELSPDGKTGTIGISSYAANALGDVVFIELPSLDSEFGAGDTIGAVESVKSASDILTPISGKVVAKNDLLEEKPATINKSPEGEAWIAKLEVRPGEVEGLMGEEEYRKFTEE